MKWICETREINQCSKLLPVRLPEADNFGGGPGTFFKIFFNFMFMIWDSRQEDWQLFLTEFWTLNKHVANTCDWTHGPSIDLSMTPTNWTPPFKISLDLLQMLPGFSENTWRSTLDVYIQKHPDDIIYKNDYDKKKRCMSLACSKDQYSLIFLTAQ